MSTVVYAALFKKIGEADEDVNQVPLVLIVVSSILKGNMLARSPTLVPAAMILLDAQAPVNRDMGFGISPNGIFDLSDLMRTSMLPPNDFSNGRELSIKFLGKPLMQHYPE